jgi:hypothetical protein
VLPSHAGDDIAEATWPQRDVDVFIHAGVATQGCTSCGKVAQPPRLEHRGVVAL